MNHSLAHATPRRPTTGSSARRALAEREYTRFDMEVAVDIASDHNFFTGFSCNLSGGGLFVATHSVSPVGTLLEISFLLPGSDAAIVAQVEVRWVRELNDQSDCPPGMGLRFLTVDAESSARIQDFIQRTREPLFHDE
jgi:uncharacterized protein (TIGR02266 family)